MFRLVYIVQCQSTGEFLTPKLNYTFNFNLAGRFTDRGAAVETAVNDLEYDFMIYEFYERASA
jgi:hypothetical protein